jgi:hypothetical protein
MMEKTETAERSAPCCAAPAKRGRFTAWLIGGAVLALALALYAGWDWLVAAGLATTVVALAPCLLMCALGLCIGRGKKS